MKSILLDPVPDCEVCLLAFAPVLFVELDGEVPLRKDHRVITLCIQNHSFLEVVAVPVIAFQPGLQVLCLRGWHLGDARDVDVGTARFGNLDFSRLRQVIDRGRVAAKLANNVLPRVVCRSNEGCAERDYN